MIRLPRLYSRKTACTAAALVAISGYFSLITPEVYTSEAEIFVEKLDRGEGLSALGLLQGSGAAREARVLKAHLESPAMLAKLDKELALRSHFSQPLDPFWSIAADAPAEAALEFYRRMTDVAVDDQTGLVQLRLRTFSPQLSQKALTLALASSEHFLNEAAAGVVAGQLQFLEEQAKKAAAVLENARLGLVSFQDHNQMLTPEGSTSPVVTAIQQIEGELVQKRSELQVLTSYMRPDSTEAKKLSTHIAALESQVSKERARLTGSGRGRVSASSAAFEKHKIRVEFATQVYKNALGALERAQLEAAKKTRTVVMVQPPTLPERQSYPRLLIAVPLTLAIGYALLGIAAMLANLIREHKR